MIKIEKTDVYGWESAIRGMRNPLNSWDKSDTIWGEKREGGLWQYSVPQIGKNDLSLMQRLSKTGNDHAKFLRMINVTVDITAPLYWWKEFDTYKVGTVANSCSTMHKIQDKEFTLDDFSHEHLYGLDEDTILLSFDSKNPPKPFNSSSLGCLEITVGLLNYYREKFLDCTVSKYVTVEECSKKKKAYWWQMIQLLPSSYNQKRTVQLNYSVLKSMYFSRRNHKLDEWHTLCEWMETLPYFTDIVVSPNEVPSRPRYDSDGEVSDRS